MKSLARSHVNWPGIDEDIITYVRNCHQCAITCSAPVKHTFQSWPITNKPMERIHIDIAGPCNGLYYFVVINAYSKWPEIFEITNITSSTIISKLTEMFARYEDPDTIVSDNGTQFVSAQFNKFVADRGITHLKTAPYHPQSNGQAERFVGTLKRALEKLKQEGTNKENLETFLQTYRSTPKPDSKSPAELFLNRKIKTILDLLKPQQEVSPIKRNVQQEMIFNEKHGAKSKSFNTNEEVFAQIFRNNKFIWLPGSIVERVGTVNYNVLVVDKNKQKLIRSHTNQLKKRFESDKEPINLAYLLFDIFDLYKPQENIHPTVQESRVIEHDQSVSTEQDGAFGTNTDAEIIQNEPDSSFHSTSESIENQTISPSPVNTESSRPKRNCQPPDKVGAFKMEFRTHSNTKWTTSDDSGSQPPTLSKN
ncbi:uncharacterized protein K02A2.6-like [Lucilia cuprina]|uniref:uncharacterized protein K02A2.6-like n=1 Tax=Lucilia cuprina TaxID=7375 RepID=UPI001F052C3E|nr:uncharacterized protein K02A2.6-like [Lucilia cuprina]